MSLTACMLSQSITGNPNVAIESTLSGTWTLVAADAIRPNGSRIRDYGAAPKGRLVIDSSGRYSLQIYKTEQGSFASSDKSKGTPSEFESAVLGSSTHYGVIIVDAADHTLTFQIDGASFPNWEGTQQKRKYEIDGDELSYRVPPRPDGNTPISVWRRVK